MPEPEAQGEAVNGVLGEADTVKDGEALPDGDGVPLGVREGPGEVLTEMDSLSDCAPEEEMV